MDLSFSRKSKKYFKVRHLIKKMVLTLRIASGMLNNMHVLATISTFCHLVMDDLKNAWNIVFFPFSFLCYSLRFCWLTNCVYKTEGTTNLLLWLKRIQSWKFGLIEPFPFLVDQYQVCRLWSINVNWKQLSGRLICGGL